MATLPSFHSSSSLSLPKFLSPNYPRSFLSFPRSPPLRFTTTTTNPRTKFPPLVFASSSTSSSFDRNDNSSKKSLLSNLIQEIEPLDVSLLQKDVSPTTLDAMKRTISGMLGLLPSDRFQVFIEALWDPLSKLLVSSMMTGYTLRNAEYRLCLERNLDISEGNLENQTPENSKLNLQGIDSAKNNEFSVKNELSSKFEEITEDPSENIGIQGLGEMSPEAQQYILHLQSHLSFAKKELHEVKRKSAALQMQQFVGEEKNDLLDYLRSLQPEKNLRDISSSSNEETNVELYDSHSYFKDKLWLSVYLLALLSAKHQVAELSEPTSPELKETIHSVVHGLLATLSPKMHSKVPPLSENNPTGPVNVGGEDCAELVENTSLQFQPLISLTRDYLARLLFWCMLLGHYLRGLEYRMELTELLSLTSDTENDADGDEQVA